MLKPRRVLLKKIIRIKNGAGELAHKCFKSIYVHIVTYVHVLHYHGVFYRRLYFTMM